MTADNLSAAGTQAARCLSELAPPDSTAAVWDWSVSILCEAPSHGSPWCELSVKHDFDCKNGIQHSRRLCAVAVRILNLESKAVKDRPQPAKHGRSRPIFRGILVCAHSITAMAHYCDVVGIDLGTTRSSIAVWDGTQVSMPISAHMTIYSAPLSVPWKRKALAAIGASMLQQRQGVQGLSENVLFPGACNRQREWRQHHPLMGLLHRCQHQKGRQGDFQYHFIELGPYSFAYRRASRLASSDRI